MEDEGRVRGEGSEVVVEAAFGGGGDERVRGGPDLLDGGLMIGSWSRMFGGR
ncbi:hypothetical protein AB0H45_30535 [Streptomyces atroolivaceus]|uniref:hypothetical protein n=1 Tax=Streptomyces atroolivaceus TaxID=66869 RepID=UPI003406A487